MFGRAGSLRPLLCLPAVDAIWLSQPLIYHVLEGKKFGLLQKFDVFRQAGETLGHRRATMTEEPHSIQV